MTRPAADYDRIAPDYDHRYRPGYEMAGVGRALLRWRRRLPPGPVLEAGCGTGHWLALLREHAPEAELYGLDLSVGMLRGAQQRAVAGLARGRAEALPFPAATFTLVFCVNALHHFSNPPAFLAAARRVLRPGGALYVVIMDPHTEADVWAVYDYFPGTRATDRERFPPTARLRRWMRQAGFQRVRTRPADVFERHDRGAAVFDDPTLERRGCSQLALLSDAEYAAGIERMRAAIRAGGATPPVFHTQITLWGTTGWAPA